MRPAWLNKRSTGAESPKMGRYLDANFLIVGNLCSSAQFYCIIKEANWCTIEKNLDYELEKILVARLVPLSIPIFIPYHTFLLLNLKGLYGVLIDGKWIKPLKLNIEAFMSILKTASSSSCD